MNRLLVLSIIPMLSGCSVFLASSGSDRHDLSVLRPGTHRASLDAEFGKPIRFVRRMSGTSSATYQYFTGDEPSYRRAAAYAVLDGVSLGLAEIVTSPVEMLQGERHTVEVVFDSKGRALSVSEFSHGAPLETPERLLGLDDSSRREAGSPGLAALDAFSDESDRASLTPEPVLP